MYCLVFFCKLFLGWRDVLNGKCIFCLNNNLKGVYFVDLKWGDLWNDIMILGKNLGYIFWLLV